MAVRRIQIVLIFIIIKNAILDTGIVNDVYKNKRFYCEGASKYAFNVNSQIQCIHRCLWKNCQLLNYKTVESGTENCEVFMESSQCLSISYEENWIAMEFQVYFHIYNLKFNKKQQYDIRMYPFLFILLMQRWTTCSFRV